MRAALTKVAEAASVLVTALRSSAIVEFLDLGADVPLRAPGNLQAALTDLRDRAAAASGSRALVDSKGRTKAGRGRALPKAGISAKTYCALVIAETGWIQTTITLHRGTRRAEKAADIYWSFREAKGIGGGDKLIAWRRHFREASDDQSQKRRDCEQEYQRHLREFAHQAQVHEDPSQGGT